MNAPRAAALLLLAVLATGCGGGEEPAAPQGLPSLASPTSSPTPSASATPADERAAVEAAVRRYFEGFNRAFDAEDPDLLAAGSTSDCGCRAVVQDLAAVLREGRVEGNRYTVLSVEVGDVQDGLATGSAVVSSSPGRIVAPDGSVVDTLSEQKAARKGLILRKEEAGWLVFSVRDA